MSDERMTRGRLVEAEARRLFPALGTELDRLRADNHDLQCVVHDLRCDLAGGVEAFEAGRRERLGEVLGYLREASRHCRQEAERLDAEGEPAEATYYVAEADALGEAADALGRWARHSVPHPPHELQARLGAAEARVRELEAEAERLRVVAWGTTPESGPALTPPRPRVNLRT